jgi:anti-sigma B factor antagonist
MPDKPAANRLTIEIERSPEVATIHCRGELVAGVTDLLYREVRPLMPNTPRIVLDFKELTYVDSSGLGILVRLYASAKTAKCDLQLANVSGRILQILGLTNLLSVFQVIGENNIRLH